jgi:predicted MFS family arabinose efflux permease
VLSAASAFGCSFAALAVGIGLIVVASTYQLAIVGLLVMGLGIAWMSPNLSASTVDAVSVDRRGLTLGVVRAAHSLAPAVGVAMLEPLVSRIGVRGVLMLNVALALLLAGVTTIQALKSRTVILGTQRA